MECISFLLIPDHCFFFSLQTLSFKSYFIRLYYCPLLFFVAIIRSYHMLHTHPITFYSLKILALDLLTRYNNTVVIILGNLNTCVDDTSISILTYCSLMIFILANSKLFSCQHTLFNTFMISVSTTPILEYHLNTSNLLILPGMVLPVF